MIKFSELSRWSSLVYVVIVFFTGFWLLTSVFGVAVPLITYLLSTLANIGIGMGVFTILRYGIQKRVM